MSKGISCIVKLYPVLWVCLGTHYHPYVVVKPPLDQTDGHLKEETRNYFCMDDFKTFHEVWHCNMTRAKYRATCHWG